MKNKNPQQQGFHLVEILIVLLVFSVVGLVGWRVMSRTSQHSAENNVNSSQESRHDTNKDPVVQDISWQWNDIAWVPNISPPECTEPIRFSVAPSDLSLATSKLYPGEYRGGNYKPHGGLAYDKNADNNVIVKAIMDGDITTGSRYIESGEVQYLLWIENDCGIAYRFDHLLTLAPAIQALVDRLPPAKADDSRTTNFAKPLRVKAGDTIATAIGHTKPEPNIGYDLGVYDLRKPNERANDPAYKAAHQTELSQAAHAVCWFDMFSSADSARLQNLPLRNGAKATGSDYCK